jgi:hypothetical protein
LEEELEIEDFVLIVGEDIDMFFQIGKVGPPIPANL